MTHANLSPRPPAPAAWTAFVGTIALACASYLYMQVPATAAAPGAAQTTPAAPSLHLDANDPCARAAALVAPTAPAATFTGTRLALPMPRRRRRRQSRAAAFFGRFERLAAMLREWHRRDRSRDELAGFDAHALRDIGLARSDASFESGKFFWQR